MSETFLYLVTRGRNSGQPRRIEIWFVQLDDKFYLVAEQREQTHWVQNLLAYPEAELSVGTRAHPTSQVARTAAHGRIVDPAREPELAARVRASMDAKYDWSDGLIVELRRGV